MAHRFATPKDKSSSGRGCSPGLASFPATSRTFIRSSRRIYGLRARCSTGQSRTLPARARRRYRASAASKAAISRQFESIRSGRSRPRSRRGACYSATDAARFPSRCAPETVALFFGAADKAPGFCEGTIGFCEGTSVVRRDVEISTTSLHRERNASTHAGSNSRALFSTRYSRASSIGIGSL